MPYSIKWPFVIYVKIWFITLLFITILLEPCILTLKGLRILSIKISERGWYLSYKISFYLVALGSIIIAYIFRVILEWNPLIQLHNFDHQPISAKAINWFTKSLASADIGSSLSKTRYIWKVYWFTTYSENLWFVGLKF